MGLSDWHEKRIDFLKAGHTMDMETPSLLTLMTGDVSSGVNWLACWTLVAACLIGAAVAWLAKRPNAPSHGGSPPDGAAVRRRKRSEDTVQTFDSDVPEDVSKDYMEITLERSQRSESWGFVWHVQAFEAQRFLIAGLEAKSPAGQLKDRQAQGLRPLRRGDELVSVNGACHFQSMRRHLARAEKVRLQFLKADLVLPLECDSCDCDSPTAATTKPGPVAAPGSTRSPSSQPSQPSPQPNESQPADLSPNSPQGELAEVAGTQCSTAFCAVEHSLPALPFPCDSLRHVPDNIPESITQPPAMVRGRDTAVKRADVPNWCKEKRKSRRHASTGAEEEGRFSSNSSGSGSEQVSGESKCPSTDWEYMMDNRPGSLLHTELATTREPQAQSSQSLHSMPRTGTVGLHGDFHAGGNVVIVAGSQAMALQTGALSAVVGGGLFQAPQLPQLPQLPQVPQLPLPQIPLLPQAHILSQAPAEASGLAVPSVPSVPCLPVQEDYVQGFPTRTVRSGQVAMPQPTSTSLSQGLEVSKLPHESHGSQESHEPTRVPDLPFAQTESAASLRSGSAPPRSCFLEPEQPNPQKESFGKKRTYRSGKRIRAKRTRAAQRAQVGVPTGHAAQGGEAEAEEGAGEPPSQRPRAGSAPAALRSLELRESSEKGYYKPRRRAGKKVRQRMEHAIARRKEQALMAEAAENCRMVSDDEPEPHEAPVELRPVAKPVAVPHTKPSHGCLKRADSPTSVSTCTTAAATMVSGVASTTTTATTSASAGSERVAPRRSFYARKLHDAPALPTMQEGCRVTAPEPALAHGRHTAQRPQRRASRTRAPKAGPEPPGASEIVGQRVLLTGLVHAPHFNGHWGYVDGFDPDEQRYIVRVFLGEPGTPPTLAKLRRECFIVPKGPALEERQRQLAAWQPTLRLLADDP